MIAIVPEDRGLPVERKLGLGRPLIVRPALLSGEVDAYRVGTLSALDPVVMADPKRAQIVDEVAPVIRAAVLVCHPGLRDRLGAFFAGLVRRV